VKLLPKITKHWDQWMFLLIQDFGYKKGVNDFHTTKSQTRLIFSLKEMAHF
jgi:hypothetical protein